MTTHACTKLGWQNTWESRLPASPPPWASTSRWTEADKYRKNGEKLTPPIIQEAVQMGPESTSGTKSAFIRKMCEIGLRMRVHLHQEKSENSSKSLREHNIHEVPETGQNRPRDRSTPSRRKTEKYVQQPLGVHRSKSRFPVRSETTTGPEVHLHAECVKSRSIRGLMHSV